MEIKNYCIHTYGCQANVADSQRLESLLGNLGLAKVEDPSECDVFIINSCSVRQKSEDKVYGLGKVLKSYAKKPFVVLMGCMVGSVVGDRKRYDMRELQKRTPWVDLYVGPGEAEAVVEALRPYIPRDSQAYINISTGCDNFCSYCVVPYARGEEVSKSQKAILQEVRDAVAKGKTQIVLCGQNVNSWGLGKKEKFAIRTGSEQKLPFTALLGGVVKIEGVERVEFISSNPFDFTNDLVKTLKLPKIADYLHIAVQSGNNDVLKRMNRRHTVEEFLALVEKIKEVRPDMRLGTDIIVGFPGETWDQFMDTVKLFEKVQFDVAYISMYSERKGTQAAKLYEDDVPLAEKRKRHAYLTRVWENSKV